MNVYRITGKKFASDTTGTGAAMYGGRWNKKGTPVLYTSGNKETALLETVVHTPPMLVPKLDLLTFEIPDDSITEIQPNDLPSNWIDYPAPSILAEIGDQWIRQNASIALKVPCCIINDSFNYILNCRHPRYSEIKLLEHNHFHFDSRLKQ